MNLTYPFKFALPISGNNHNKTKIICVQQGNKFMFMIFFEICNGHDLKKFWNIPSSCKNIRVVNKYAMQLDEQSKFN